MNKQLNPLEDVVGDLFVNREDELEFFWEWATNIPLLLGQSFALVGRRRTGILYSNREEFKRLGKTLCFCWLAIVNTPPCCLIRKEITMSSKQDQPEHSNDEKKLPEEPKEQLSQTQHLLIMNGQEIYYTATAGTMIIREEDEEGAHKPKASIFFVAYTLDGVEDGASRPLTFSFNGGPGSSSVWLHLGLLGPRRTLMGQDGKALPPPYRLVDNEHSLLDVTDLVFIDPVSTGYSRAVQGEKAKEFHDFEKDIESVAEFRAAQRAINVGHPPNS